MQSDDSDDDDDDIVDDDVDVDDNERLKDWVSSRSGRSCWGFFQRALLPVQCERVFFPI